jgi:hypothetical protein
MLLSERPNGKNNIRFVKDRFTDNPYKDTSALTMGLGTRIRVNWDNSDPSLLYPGMQVKFLYKDAGLIKEMKGVLIGLEVITSPSTGSILDNHYITQSVLTLQINKVG